MEAKQITEKIKKQLEKHIEHKNSIEIEKIEKKLKDLTHESFWDKFIKNSIRY